MDVFNRKDRQPDQATTIENGTTNGNHEKPTNGQGLPTHNRKLDGIVKSKHIKPEGESGRRFVSPSKFPKLVWKSSSKVSGFCNLLWPFVPAAIVLHFLNTRHHAWTFAINYVAMVPVANLLGYAGQEFARKLPTVAGILIETTLGSVVEIVIFMVLLAKHNPNAEVGHGNLEYVLQAAILGSILTNLLLCLGFCFLVGGMKHKEQKFHGVISEAGSGILLVAGFALLIPSAFFSALKGSTVAAGEAGEGEEVYTMTRLQHDTLNVSHGVAVILIAAFAIYIIYNAFSHDNIFNEVLQADEEADRDRHRDINKEKLTMTECAIAIVISIALVSMIAVFLIEEIEYIVSERHVPDNFLGLILVPLVEKFAEHLTAVDEAYGECAH
jgi:Ca2+:H+ antiporter